MKSPTHSTLILIACLVALAAIAVLHFMLPPDVSMFIAYLVPIGVAAHTLRAAPAAIVTSVALVAWIAVHATTNTSFTFPVVVWNSFSRAILFFGVLAYGQFLAARIRSEQEARQILESMLRQHNPFSRSLLACGECGRFNTETDRWLDPPQFISERAGVEVFTCICPECLKRQAAGTKQG